MREYIYIREYEAFLCLCLCLCYWFLLIMAANDKQKKKRRGRYGHHRGQGFQSEECSCEYEAKALYKLRSHCCHQELTANSFSVCASRCWRRAPNDTPASAGSEQVRREWVRCVVPSPSGTAVAPHENPQWGRRRNWWQAGTSKGPWHGGDEGR